MPEHNNSGLGIIGQFAQNMCIFCSSCQIVGPTGIFASHPHVVGQVVVAYDDLAGDRIAGALLYWLGSSQING